MNKKQVTKDEFDLFIKNYPNKLDIDICGIFEPPIKSYNDFILGMWPESVIAFMNENDEYNGYEYFIKI